MCVPLLYCTLYFTLPCNRIDWQYLTASSLIMFMFDSSEVEPTASLLFADCKGASN